MTLPPANTPLYNHPLPEIEEWLSQQGCRQDSDDLHCWQVQRAAWKAELRLETDQLTIRYFDFGEGDRAVQRAFKYSLSRQDLEDAIFSGP
ncbi:MAG TPA: DUF3143 domain-containing protein [Thermosynechococcaceae cyanobacterium]